VNLCPGCRQDFSSVSAFDRHRVGRHAYGYLEGLRMESPREDGRRCLDEGEMRSAGMALDLRGRWCITRDVEQARKLRIRTESLSEGLGGTGRRAA
jgi:hypothetical protein